MSLKQILTMVARNKGIVEVSRWVEQKLSHCEVSSDYHTWVHLKSRKGMYFGVRDAQFQCQPFILYREMMHIEERPEREFEIYTFTSLEDDRFKQLIVEAYHDFFDTIRDIRVFYETTPICIRVKTETGYAVLGSYNDLQEPLEIETNLYCLTLKGSSICMYSNSWPVIEQKLIDLRELFADTGELGEAVSDSVFVTHSGKVLDVRLSKVGANEWKVSVN